MKLVLLSATPMFDTADEIVFLLNLLLLNDKRLNYQIKGYIFGWKTAWKRCPHPQREERWLYFLFTRQRPT